MIVPPSKLYTVCICVYYATVNSIMSMNGKCPLDTVFIPVLGVFLIKLPVSQRALKKGGGFEENKSIKGKNG
jgi:hypothetical protein